MVRGRGVSFGRISKLPVFQRSISRRGPAQQFTAPASMISPF